MAKHNGVSNGESEKNGSEKPKTWQSAGASNQDQENELSKRCETEANTCSSQAQQYQQEQNESVEEPIPLEDSKFLVSGQICNTSLSDIHVSGSISSESGELGYYSHFEEEVSLRLSKERDSRNIHSTINLKPSTLPLLENQAECTDDIGCSSELAERNWEERLSVPEEDLKGFVPQREYSWTDRQLSIGKDYCAERVGLLSVTSRKDSSSFGTFIHLGKGYGTTCWHCMEAVVDIANGEGNWKTCEVKFVLPDRRVKCFMVERNISYVNQEYDVVVLKLCPNEYDFPPPFDEFEFSDTNDEELPLLVAGFQVVEGCKMLDIGKTVKLKKLPKEDVEELEKNLEQAYGIHFTEAYKGLEKPHNEWLISKMIDGASGGAGITINQHDKVVLHLMYQKGYPGAFYRSSFCDRKKAFCSRYLVETGISIKSVTSDFPAELITKIFQ